jgi:hypothetical protein
LFASAFGLGTWPSLSTGTSVATTMQLTKGW